MDALIMYALFAITTGITACILLLAPVLELLQEQEPTSTLLEYKHITYPTFFCMATLLAPIVVLSAIVPKYSAIFQATLLDTMKS